MPVIMETALPGLKLAGRGKVRDIYDLGDRLLIVATDRISAFDCILPTGIPDKGRVLTSMSRFWFDEMRDVVPNHLQRTSINDVPASIQSAWPGIADRSMIVWKAIPFPVECVARGYLSGSAWKEYRENSRTGAYHDGAVPCAGVLLPSGLVESSRLPEPVFTPATKAETGHDENIPFERMESIVGPDAAATLRKYTL
ncbi:MAG TPA: phosphoribosylaminoimidazolesuccinocarboxamide synthase, partial [Armatimonadota bacterium]|nr:phosphoribosylaminoimidazolesuccinocarboxamide synthase [Armatimonadota bacterium]